MSSSATARFCRRALRVNGFITEISGDCFFARFDDEEWEIPLDLLPVGAVEGSYLSFHGESWEHPLVLIEERWTQEDLDEAERKGREMAAYFAEHCE